MTPDSDRTVPLHALAHARAGDKGNHSNIAVFAYRAEDYPWLLEQLTEERVKALFSSRAPTSVRRYPLPLLCGFNFVLENVLEGGVNESLNLDMHGKALSFLLLSLQIKAPKTLAGQPVEARALA